MDGKVGRGQQSRHQDWQAGLGGRRGQSGGGGPGARRRGRGAELGLSVLVRTRGVAEVRGLAEVPGEAGPGRGGGLQREGRLYGSSALGARQSGRDLGSQVCELLGSKRSCSLSFA